MKLNRQTKENGITLVALVVTIVVLIILAGVSINLVIGSNGIMSKAKQSKIRTSLASYKEQLGIFIADKKIENTEFYEESLTAGKTSVAYNTKTNNDEKTIKDIIKNITDEDLEKIEIIKGKLIVNTKDKNVIEAAQNVGVEPNPYNIENGELKSDSGNLLLVDENGTLRLPDSVTKISSGAFSNVEGLRTIIIPGTVKEIGINAFANNQTLENVIMEDGVETIGGWAFQGCKNLAEVELPDTITTIAAGAFYTCQKLEYIEIPVNIETIESYAFCTTGLTNIKFRGNNIKTIKDSAFGNCNFTEFEIQENVESIDKAAFNGCKQLDKIQINSKNTKFIYTNGMLMSSSKSNVLFVSKKYYENKTTFEIPEGVTEFGCKIIEFNNITKLIIPSSLQKLGVNVLPTTIDTVEVANNNNYLKTAENCIYTKTEPKTLLFCYSKESKVELKEPAEVIAAKSFIGATKAKEIIFNNETKTFGYQIFNGNGTLTDVTIGEKAENINSMFAYRMFNLNITISEKNPNYIIENRVLYTKNKEKLITALYEINGKFSLIDEVKEIAEQAFYSQDKMTEIDLNKVEILNSENFAYCTNLEKIEIPKTIKTINIRTFLNATNLKEIIIHKKENSISGAPWGSPLGLRAIKWE